MKIAILEAGLPPSPLIGRFGAYSGMFRRLLGPAFDYEVFDVQAGMLPAKNDRVDAYLITGSSSGVYDGEEWITEFEAFVRERVGTAPMIGVCFGHQLMAQALGGQVIKSPKGWGLGLHRYDIVSQAVWMDDCGPITLQASHQDQVVAIGPDARVLARNDFTPFAVLDYPALAAMSVQPHPEFDADFAIALLENDRGRALDAATADAAIRSSGGANDCARVATWMRRFLDTAMNLKAATGR